METRESSSTGGIGYGGVLFIVFLVLKLTHVIDWSWWWVTAPLWIPVSVVVMLFVGWMACEAVKARNRRRELRRRLLEHERKCRENTDNGNRIDGEED